MPPRGTKMSTNAKRCEMRAQSRPSGDDDEDAVVAWRITNICMFGCAIDCCVI